MKKTLLFFFLATTLFSQTGLNFKITEFGVLNYSDSKSTASDIVLKEKPKMDKIPEVALLKQFIPVEQKFTLEVNKKNTITGLSGVRLEIPEKAFSEQEDPSVQVFLTEFIDELDFISSGYGQIFYDKYGGEKLMISGGMFKIRFQQKEKDVQLEKGKFIEVQFPDYFPKESFGLYFLEKEGIWSLKSSLSKSDKSTINPTGQEGKQVIGVRLANIDKAGLWNFASTELTHTCIKSSVETYSTTQTAIIIPKHFRGYIIKEIKDKDFFMNAYKNTIITLVLLDGKNKIGFIPNIETSDKVGSEKSDSKNSFRQEVGKIEFKNITEEQILDRIKFKTLIGLPTFTPYISYKK
jgi:hypothetical protein